MFCRAELLPSLLKLLKDLEAEVRIAAASKVPAFSRVLSVDQVILFHRYVVDAESATHIAKYVTRDQPVS